MHSQCNERYKWNPRQPAIGQSCQSWIWLGPRTPLLSCWKRFILTPEVVSVQQSGKTNKTRQDILCHCLGYLSHGKTTSHFLVTFVSEEVQGKLHGPWTVLRSEQEYDPWSLDRGAPGLLLVRLLGHCFRGGQGPTRPMRWVALPAPPLIAVGQSGRCAHWVGQSRRSATATDHLQRSQN